MYANRMIRTGIGAAILLAGGSMLAHASTNPTVKDDWKSGNAGFECEAIGEYAYAYKWNESCDTDASNCEGAPNGTEVARFYDSDYNLIHENYITIANSNGKVFDWSSHPNGIGAVIVKAGTGANVWLYNPQVKSDTGLYAYQNRDISHVTFCWNLDEQPRDEQWCSPGYWRQEHHYESWAATGYEANDLFYDAIGYYPTLSKQGQRAGATTNPTLLQVLEAPQWYGGDAFNAVGDLLSGAHPDVNFNGERVPDSCPLN